MNRRSFLTTIGAFATAVVGERLVRPRDSIEPVPFDGKQESCPALSPSPPAGPPQPGTMTGGAPAPSITSEDIRRAADLLDEHAVPMDGRVLWVNREAFEVLRERAQVEAEVCDRSRVSSLIGPYHQTYFHGIEIRPITFSNWSRPDFRGRIYSDYARELGRAMATREDEMVQDILTRSS